MSATDRHRLLHGSYRPPALCRGDRASCLFRDGEVIITGWSATRMPLAPCAGAGRLVAWGMARSAGGATRWVLASLALAAFGAKGRGQWQL